MDRIEAFYSQPYFENYKYTDVFGQYLEIEEKRITQDICGGSVLEIGSGTGRVLTMLPRLTDRVIGVERSRRLYEVSKTQVKQENIEIVLGDFLTVDLKGPFDWVLATWNTFGNFYEKRDAAFDKALGLLAQKGRIFLSVLSENALEPYLEMMRLSGLSVEKITDDYVFLKEGLISERFSRDKLARIFRRFGVRYCIQKLTPISYWCECRRDQTQSPKP